MVDGMVNVLVQVDNMVDQSIILTTFSRERDSKLEGIDLSQFEYPGGRSDQSARRLINPRYIKSHHAHRRRQGITTTTTTNISILYRDFQ